MAALFKWDTYKTPFSVSAIFRLLDLEYTKNISTPKWLEIFD